MPPVLLVDDVSPLAALLRQVLEEAGYPVAAVPDVAEALAVLRDVPNPVIVLFNASAPRDLRGLLDTAVGEPALRRHAYVMLTAYPEGLAPALRPLLTALGAQEIAKPFGLDALLAAVAAAAATVPSA